MFRRSLMLGMLSFLAMPLALSGSAPASTAGDPETVMVTLHARPGAAAALVEVVARHWDTARRLNLVLESPHVTLRSDGANDAQDIVEIFTWRDASVPDAAPAEIRSIWNEMNRLVEPRSGGPGLQIATMSLIGATAR